MTRSFRRAQRLYQNYLNNASRLLLFGPAYSMNGLINVMGKHYERLAKDRCGNLRSLADRLSNLSRSIFEHERKVIIPAVYEHS